MNYANRFLILFSARFFKFKKKISRLNPQNFQVSHAAQKAKNLKAICDLIFQKLSLKPSKLFSDFHQSQESQQMAFIPSLNHLDFHYSWSFELKFLPFSIII